MDRAQSRRSLLIDAAKLSATLALRSPLAALFASRGDAAFPHSRIPSFPRPFDPDHERLTSWADTLRAEGLTDPRVPLGRAAVRVGELARGTPYEAYTLEAYLRAGGDATRAEPLTLWLTRFDCVSLVESCLAVARAART